ncbi:hypothetical protein [Streptomyces sp. NBC_01361]|uniref:hypothetical protein n=1 Tax=Streptomyces sp. NBC_01361 TaxID=2903838 RepID=UPI002E3578EF|nr:hypothetical protein [Streptomyces sp. NBC_01361]
MTNQPLENMADPAMLQMPAQVPPIDRGVMSAGTGGDTAGVEADILAHPFWEDSWRPSPWSLSPMIVS